MPQLCCALIFSAPRPSGKVWAGCPHAHGTLMSCWWSWETAKQHQLLSWTLFSNRSNVSSSILQIVRLYDFTHSHSRHPAQQTFLCTTLSLDNADGFSKVTKEPELWTGKGFLSFPAFTWNMSGLKTHTGGFNSEGLTEAEERKTESLRTM